MIPRPGETAGEWWANTRHEAAIADPARTPRSERVLAPTEDRLFPLEFQRRIARERLGLKVDEIRGGHLPMLSRPVELAECLSELAGRRSGSSRH